MNTEDMASNECHPMEKGEELHLTNIQLLEISEAINHLDNMVSELETALNLKSGQGKTGN